MADDVAYALYPDLPVRGSIWWSDSLQYSSNTSFVAEGTARTCSGESASSVPGSPQQATDNISMEQSGDGIITSVNGVIQRINRTGH